MARDERRMGKNTNYFMTNYRFYNYPYVFAQLFVLTLYKVYKEQGGSFVSKLKCLLVADSNKFPRELNVALGVDIGDEVFLEKDMKQAEKFIDMLGETF